MQHQGFDFFKSTHFPLEIKKIKEIFSTCYMFVYGPLRFHELMCGLQCKSEFNAVNI